MATKNLSEYDINKVPQTNGKKIAIAVAEWNFEITSALLKGAVSTLNKHGVNEDDIEIRFVPGTFELTYAASRFTKNRKFDAVIAIGCVVKGETPHFDYICQGVTQGITQLNIISDIPVIFGVLTTNTMQQAKERSGGKLGNKGDEAAVTAIKMM